MTKKLKVLYLLALGRSGTTIMNRILGQLEGFFPVGELQQIWDRNIIDNRMCGCGKRFRECQLWQDIFKKAYGGFDIIDAKKMIWLQKHNVRTRHSLNHLLSGQRKPMIQRLEYYLDNLEKLYHGVADTTSSRVIVDSSKFPTYSNVLSMIPSLDVRIIHVIRDPRAVAFAWRKFIKQPDRGSTEDMMKRLTPQFSALLWNVWNYTAEKIWLERKSNYMRLRYDDFVEEPRKEIEKIVDFIEEEAVPLPFIDERTVELGSDHTASGNPNRFQTGRIEIRMDDEWKRKMRSHHRLIVSVITKPMRGRFGY